MIEPVDLPELSTVSPLEAVVESFEAELIKSFPHAEFLLGGDVEAEADVEIDVYVPDEEIEAAGIKADELALNYDLKTRVFILPIVLPLKAYPAK